MSGASGCAAVRFARTFAGCREGSIAVEFALVVPILVLLLLGAGELTRYVLANQKMQSVAVTTADLVARTEQISEADIADVFAAATSVAVPFDVANEGRVIVSSVSNASGNGARVVWQRQGGGSLVAGSRVGSSGGSATMPPGFVLRAGESAIIAETFFNFAPLVSDAVAEADQLYFVAFQRPRFGSLDAVTP